MKRARFRSLTCLGLLLSVVTAGCGGSPAATDAGSDGTVRTDGTSSTCVADRDCSDHVFCNGVERCTPGASGAGADGCVAASAAACGTGETCNEAAQTCVTGCGDTDGDGHGVLPCGDDCDDHDAARYPGHTEVCDAVGLDDDCNPTTLGSDADHDGYASSACCNVQPDSGLLCGVDCNDTEANVHPGAPESCNGVDDNCNTTIDEGVINSYYPDCDSDGFGDTAHPMTSCTFPTTGPDCGGRTGVWLPSAGDCDDAEFRIHGGLQDVCDALDNDCDGTVDGAPAEAWCNDPARNAHADALHCNTSGVCEPTTCVAPFLDCTSAPGCESDPLADPRHCGGCTTQCGHPTCALGQCARDVRRVAVGGGHACLTRIDGTVSCWGRNDFGQVGDGSILDRRVPVRTVGLTDVVAIGAGDGHTCAVRTDGTMACWGNNASGQLGNGTMVSSRTPVEVVRPAGVYFYGAPALGLYHTCAVGFDTGIPMYGLYCWGANDRGQLGNGVFGGTATPTYVPGAPVDINHTFLAAGDYHTCSAVETTGVIRCWGANDHGQLGDGTTTDRPAPVSPLGLTSPTLTGLGAGEAHTCLGLGSGGAVCWGKNDHGQLGNGATTDSATPVAVSGITYSADSIDGGRAFTCARVGGSISCWGENGDGQLGDGTTTDRSTPVTVTGITGTVYGSGAGGSYFQGACGAIDGVVYCWGSDNNSMLGDNGAHAPMSLVPVLAYDP